MVIECVEFKDEKERDLPPPEHIIQGFIFEDLGGWTLPPPPGGTQVFIKPGLSTAGMRILSLPVMGAPTIVQNHLFVGQGKVKVSPTEETLEKVSEMLQKKVHAFKVGIIGKHYF